MSGTYKEMLNVMIASRTDHPERHSLYIVLVTWDVNARVGLNFVMKTLFLYVNIGKYSYLIAVELIYFG